MKGAFSYDGLSRRFIIAERELHCGDTFQIQVGKEWRDVRIEHSSLNGWYLIGLRSGDLTGAMHYVGCSARTYSA